MKRSLKNIIMVFMIIAAMVCAGFTYSSAASAQSAGNQTQIEMQMPSDTQTQSDSNSSDGTDTQNNQPPEMPSGDSNSNGQPPEKPSGDSNSNGQPPEMPSSDSNSNGQPPEMPSGDSNSNGQSPEMPSGNSNTQSDSDKTYYYVLFGLEAFVITAVIIYLIMSGFNKKSFKETMNTAKRALIYVLAVVVITGGLTFSAGSLAIPCNNSTSQVQMSPENNASSSVDAAGATTVDGNEKTLSDTYTSTTADESAVLVTNGGTATISGATVNKKSGDSSNTENSEFYGVNSGILVQQNSTANIENATISTSASGANAVFATGENAKIYIKNSTITTSSERSSRGLDATYGGYIEADNVKITTQGGSCATLATDRGEGTVIAKNSTLETNGSGSPVIYSTGDITVENTTGTANSSQIVVIEGKNSATVTNSTLTASAAGNRGDTDVAGVMIYQSMSGDAGEGTGTFNATDSALSVQSSSKYYKTAPMFFVTNTNAVINLTNTKLTFGSGVLISAKGTSEWGTSTSNGGNVTLNAKNQTLTGNIEADKISTVTLNLTSSTYEGTINADNSAKEVTLKLDKNSKIKLTGNSYVTSLENADSSNSNIDFNGYTLYVNGKAVN